MRLLKTLFTFSLLMLVVTACGGGNAKSTNAKQIKGGEKTMKVVHLTKAEFLNKVYNFEKNPDAWKFEGNKPAIVDFFATWCGPCKALSPIMEELAEEYNGKVDIYKIDVDQEEELAAAFGVRSIPTLLFIPLKGKPVITQGAMPKAELKDMIEKNLLK